MTVGEMVVALKVVREGLSDLDHVAVDHTPGGALKATERWLEERLGRLIRETVS